MSDTDQLNTPVDLTRDGRAFRVEFEPSPLVTGWMLRERHHDSWPVMAGPFDTRATAVDYIDELLDAAPLCCYKDEHGYQSCWI